MRVSDCTDAAMVQARGVTLAVYLNDDDLLGKQRAYRLVIAKCLKMGLAGATLHASELGFGTRRQWRTADSNKGAADLPVHVTEIRRLPDGRVTFHVGYEYR